MSIIKQKKQRVAIFIDAQNLYHSAKSAYNANVNFKNILTDTLAERELVRAIAYVITTESGEEKSFFEALTKSGIETKSKNLQIFLGGAKKGDWDVGIAVDAIRLAPKVDAIILVSGDGDFVPLMEYLKFSFGCQVEVATFSASASANLVKVTDDFFDLSQNLSRYLIRSFKNYNYNKYKKYNNFSKNDEVNSELEVESPEMIAERVALKKPLPKIKNSDDLNKQTEIKKETEVEISRVKKEDILVSEKKETKKKSTKKSTKKTGEVKKSKSSQIKNSKKSSSATTTKEKTKKKSAKKQKTEF